MFLQRSECPYSFVQNTNSLLAGMYSFNNTNDKRYLCTNYLFNEDAFILPLFLHSLPAGKRTQC